MPVSAAPQGHLYTLRSPPRPCLQGFPALPVTVVVPALRARPAAPAFIAMMVFPGSQPIFSLSNDIHRSLMRTSRTFPYPSPVQQPNTVEGPCAGSEGSAGSHSIILSQRKLGGRFFCSPQLKEPENFSSSPWLILCPPMNNTATRSHVRLVSAFELPSSCPSKGKKFF